MSENISLALQALSATIQINKPGIRIPVLQVIDDYWDTVIVVPEKFKDSLLTWEHRGGSTRHTYDHFYVESVQVGSFNRRVNPTDAEERECLIYAGYRTPRDPHVECPTCKAMMYDDQTSYVNEKVAKFKGWTDGRWGYSSMCKECAESAKAEYKEANPEEK